MSSDTALSPCQRHVAENDVARVIGDGRLGISRLTGNVRTVPNPLKVIEIGKVQNCQ